MPLPDVAIVGIGFRFPGGATGSESLWDLLIRGKTCWSKVPSSRFNDAAFRKPERGQPGSYTHTGGYFLEQDPLAFDSGFFGMSEQEATSMDPQQRQLLETTFECLENAGIPASKISGSRTGVYIASFMHDFENQIHKDPLEVPKYAMTGMGLSMYANRLSHYFDLRGPSMTIDTGCSGSLTTVHQACQSLWLEETDLMLAGGVNLILNPDSMQPLDLLQ